MWLARYRCGKLGGGGGSLAAAVFPLAPKYYTMLV